MSARENHGFWKCPNVSEWREFAKGDLRKKGMLPPDIPSAPWTVYANIGWAGIGNWIGTGIIAPQLRKYRDFKDARLYVRSLNISSSREWRDFCRGQLPCKGSLPSDIPASPHHVYSRSGWKSMGDWLGTGIEAPQLRKFLPFNEARVFARRLNLRSGQEWIEFCKGNLPEKGVLPKNIPASPDKNYANSGWVSMGDWLGTGAIAARLKKFRSFKEARSFARSLGLKNGSEWRDYCKGNLPHIGYLPPDIPVTPQQIYAGKGWTGVGDWLGTGFVANTKKRYRSFKSARRFARTLGLRNQSEWREYCKGIRLDLEVLPEDIPAHPYSPYANNGWSGWRDWLGTDRTRSSRSKNAK